LVVFDRSDQFLAVLAHHLKEGLDVGVEERLQFGHELFLHLETGTRILKS